MSERTTTPEQTPRTRLLRSAAVAATASIPLVSLPGLESPFSTPKITLLAVCIVGGTIALISRGTAAVRVESPLQKLALAWLALVSASALWTETVSLRSLLIALLPPASFLLLTWLKPSPAALATALVTSGSVIAGFAVLQYLGLDPFRLIGWQAPVAGSTRMRVYATLGNPNFVAACLACILPVTWVFDGSRLRRILFASAGSLILVGIIVTGSRAPVVGFGVLTLFAGWLFRSVSFRRRALVLISIVLFAFLVAMLSSGRPIPEIVRGRLFIWRVSLAQVSIRTLILGEGPGSFAIRYPEWETRWVTSAPKSPETIRFLGYQDHAHNDWVEILVEHGMAGLALMLAAPAWAFWAFRRRNLPFGSPAGRALAGVAIFGGVACVDFPFHRPAEFFVFWTLLAIVHMSVSTVLDSDAGDRTMRGLGEPASRQVGEEFNECQYHPETNVCSRADSDSGRNRPRFTRSL